MTSKITKNINENEEEKALKKNYLKDIIEYVFKVGDVYENCI